MIRAMGKPNLSLQRPRGYEAWVAIVRNYQKCLRVMSLALEDTGLSVAQHEILLAIGLRPGLTQQDLAERLLVVKSNISGLLHRLEAQGLVRRKPHPEDARSKCIELTPEGRRRLERSFAAQNRVVEAMMGRLDNEELGQSRDFSRRVSEALDRLLEEQPGARSTP
jgi:DNA-binding MarR family transcriptional regulator